MVDDKQKTKKALLGELESIKSLLTESDDTIDFGDGNSEDFDPPILTTTVDHHNNDEIPVLTEAFDDHHLDPPTLTDSTIDDTRESNMPPPVFEQWPEPEELEQDQPIQDLASGLGPQRTIEKQSNDHLFDNLESEFEQQFQTENVNTDPNSQPKQTLDSLETEAEVNDDFVLKPEVDGESSENDNPLENDAGTIAPKKKAEKSQPSLFDEPRIDEPQSTDPLSKTADEIKPVEEKEVDHKIGGEESLLQQDQIKHTKTIPTSTSTPMKPTSSDTSSATPRPAIKTDNPFLPKHIRDRLHTSRSLQDEIMDSSFSSSVAHTESQAANDASSHNSSVSEQKIIDDVIDAFLPKIEQELRRRLQQLINDKPAPSSPNDKS